MIKAIKQNALWGIIDNERLAVPPIHSNRLEAIHEWRYFETLNSKKQFMKHKRTPKEIDSIFKNLKETSYHK
ncbi:hypothetical protein ACRTDU_04450 [Sunxiuqinia elliptica]